MMLNNAEPRIISNGLDPFVASHYMITMNEKFFEMDNNAWSVVSNPPVTPSWEQHIETFQDHKNFPLAKCGEFYQDTTPLSSDRASNPQRTPTYAAIHPRQQPNKGQSFSIPLHPVPSMNHDYDSSPTLGIDYSQMSMNQGRRSFAAFQSCRSSTSLSMNQVPFSFNTLRTEECFRNDNTSPSTVYSSLSTSNKSSLNTCDTLDLKSGVTHNGAESDWCSDRINNHTYIHNNIDNHAGEMSRSYEVSNFHDGLPRPEDRHLEHFGDPWSQTYELPSNWPCEPFIQGTVRPKALNLNTSFASTTSIATTASSHASTYSSSEFTAVANSPEDTPSSSRAGDQLVAEQTPQSRPRHTLPSSRPIKNDDAELSGLPSNVIVTNKPEEPRQITSSPVKHRRARASTPIISAVANTRSHSVIKKNLDTKDHIVPTEPQNDLVHDTCPPAIDAPQLSDRSAQNGFLVNSRRAGMSYRTIRTKGKFTDAESTLRGRFRTLTKDKKDRVRRPEWTDNDLKLLSNAAKQFGRGNREGSEPKVQWKKVAEYIAENGGSYRFGYATCRKRWVELEGPD
ncbi:hypothetical protein SBOR_9009 [Sclerotinia borealis F-4128]|uniref:Myb-like domain-containing protein n=1 Tax=Sclerotinia borealis (strain F-4128) TaxID=1432307 RepID=W9C3Y9_SCLBF|nr:hypothetical protein SBOR_9009 [Sclerotinia borealis F-4128]